jgi:hypothetical protein
MAQKTTTIKSGTPVTCTNFRSFVPWNCPINGFPGTTSFLANQRVVRSGINNCGTTSSQSSMCQTLWMNDATDFCLWAPPTVGNIGDTEREEVAWCTKSGRGTRVIPNGSLKGVHFVRTKDYVQVTGVGDFTKINVQKGDEGGGKQYRDLNVTSLI